MSIRMMYILSSFAQSNVGKTIAIRMIPPIVGVPDFSCCPSSPKSRTVLQLVAYEGGQLIFFQRPC